MKIFPNWLGGNQFRSIFNSFFKTIKRKKIVIVVLNEALWKICSYFEEGFEMTFEANKLLCGWLNS